MASVFLSYDRDDAARAKSVASALEKAGHSVWWDRYIKGGSQYSKEIERALERSAAVIVLWSRRSVDSAWVRDEAATGRDSGRLVPVRIDDADVPLGFRQFQTIDLRRGSRASSGMRDLLDAIAAIGGSKPSEEQSTPKRDPRVRHLPLLAIGLAVTALAALLMWRPWIPRGGLPTVAVAATNQGSEGWARDLLVQLGNLHAKAETVKLIDSPATARTADLVFEIAGRSGPQGHHASLVLFAGKDRTLLWSRDFEAEGAQTTDLKQRLSLNAARVLGCALEGLAVDRKQLPQPALKLYLTGCAEFADVAGYRSNAVVPTFIKVTQQAPKFRPGWAKLLLSEANTFIYWERDHPDPADVRRHIEAARRTAPGLPEAELAEMALTPPGDLARRMALIEKAVRADPDNAWLLSARGLQHGIVGRLNDAIADARSTAELDPLSPGAVGSYISVLAYTGRPDAAFAELRRAEQAWPGSTVLLDTRYRLLVRFGDPKEALEFARSDAIQRQGRQSLEPFLLARVHPTEQNIESAIAHSQSVVKANPGAIRVLVQTLVDLGREREAVQLLMQPSSANPQYWLTDTFFRPGFRNIRRDPRFMAVAARFGLVRYWRSSGKWPDFCLEPGLPYDCKAEAAKLTN